MSKQNIKISIFGKSYVISTDQDEHHIQQAAAMVDGQMKQALEKAPSLSEAKAAVFTCLQLAAELVALRSDADDTDASLRYLTGLLDHYDSADQMQSSDSL